MVAWPRYQFSAGRPHRTLSRLAPYAIVSLERTADSEGYAIEANRGSRGG